MAISRIKKEEVVKDLKIALNNAKIVIFTDFKGVEVKDLTNLRKKVREAGGKYLVAKKTLINIALQDLKIDSFNPLALEGQIGIVFGNTDAVSTSKVVYEIQKQGETLKILNGIMDPSAGSVRSTSSGQVKVLNAEEIIKLAQLPTIDVLLAQVVGSIKAPVSGFVNVLRGNIQGLIFALKAIQQNK